MKKYSVSTKAAGSWCPRMAVAQGLASTFKFGKRRYRRRAFDSIGQKRKRGRSTKRRQAVAHGRKSATCKRRICRVEGVLKEAQGPCPHSSRHRVVGRIALDNVLKVPQGHARVHLVCDVDKEHIVNVGVISSSRPLIKRAGSLNRRQQAIMFLRAINAGAGTWCNVGFGRSTLQDLSAIAGVIQVSLGLLHGVENLQTRRAGGLHEVLAHFGDVAMDFEHVSSFASMRLTGKLAGQASIV